MEKRRPNAILYSRVSTMHDEQADSIENQILLAKNYLAKHPELELAEPLEKYSEIISAKTDIRPKFQELCERLARGDIDFLLIKDLKRLSRSVEITYAFFNLMKQYNFEIIQLSTGNIINCKAFEESESNLLLGIEALFAQNVVLTQSRYARTTQKVRCENKQLSFKDSRLFGYEWDRKRKDIIIIEEKAKIVRELFKRFAFCNYSIRELQTFLSAQGYRYSCSAISKWLQEEKYIGDWTINRYGSTLGIGQGAKSHEFKRDKSEWVHIERPDLAIVDKELFDLAQRIRLNRVRRFETREGIEKLICRNSGKHLFSGKIYCAECGSSYQFRWGDRNKTIAMYYDSYSLKADIKCPNIRFHKVYEENIRDIVISSIGALNVKGKISISRMIEAISWVIQNNNYHDQEIESEKEKLKTLERQSRKIMDAVDDATPAMKSRLNDRAKEIERRIMECKRSIMEQNDCTAKSNMLKERLTTIEKQLSGWIDITEASLSRAMVDKLISKISIHKDGKMDVLLNFGNITRCHFISDRTGRRVDKNKMRVAMPSAYMVNDILQQVLKKSEAKGKDDAVINLVGFNAKTNGIINNNITVGFDLAGDKTT